MKIRYQPRWKEILDGFVEHHHFSVEITMGDLHVYFPTEEAWNATAPEWAKDLWPEARDGAEEWSRKNAIPFEVDQAAWVDFDTQQAEQGVAPNRSLPPTLKSTSSVRGSEDF